MRNLSKTHCPYKFATCWDGAKYTSWMRQGEMSVLTLNQETCIHLRDMRQMIQDRICCGRKFVKSDQGISISIVS